jgi:hypothetical protein
MSAIGVQRTLLAFPFSRLDWISCLPFLDGCFTRIADIQILGKTVGE